MAKKRPVPWWQKVRNMYGTARWTLLKAQRHRGLKKKYPNGKVSAHFRYQEFATHDGTPIPLNATRGLEAHCRRFLEPLRSQFGPCHVLSGYRHYHYNRAIGGASDSRHDWDKHPTACATDLVFARGTPAQWGAAAARLRAKHGGWGGIGIYPRSGFVHVDSRDYKADWHQ